MSDYLSVIHNPSSWQKHFAYHLREERRPDPKKKVNILVLGPYGVGKSALINTIYRSLFNDKRNWWICKSGNFDSHVTKDPEELVIHSQLAIYDFIGLEQVTPQIVEILIKLLSGQNLKESDLIVLRGNDDSKPEWKVLNSLVITPDEQIKMLPNVVLVVVAADSKEDNEEFKATLELLEGLKSVGFPYLIAITKSTKEDKNQESNKKALRNLNQVAMSNEIIRINNYTTPEMEEEEDIKKSAIEIVYKSIKKGYLGKVQAPTHLGLIKHRIISVNDNMKPYIGPYGLPVIILLLSLFVGGKNTLVFGVLFVVGYMIFLMFQ